MLARWLVRLKAIFRRAQVEAEFDEELRFHLEQETERNVARGMSPQEARRAAFRAFGDPGRLKEEARETWRWRWLDELAQDARYGVRGLWRSPGFAAVAVLSLGFGIGATSTLFGVVDALDFRPLPYDGAERLVFLAEARGPDDRSCPNCPLPTSFSTIARWRAQARSFEGISLVSGANVYFRNGDVTDSRRVGFPAPGFFEFLGVGPLFGRAFAPADTVAGAEPVAVLSHETWRLRFGGDRSVVGARLEYYEDRTLADRRSVTVIGVMPEGFQFGSEVSFWLPLSGGAGPRAAGSPTAIARLRPGVSLAAARRELRGITSRLAVLDPEAREGRVATVLPLRERLGWGAGAGRGVLFGLSGLVLLIAVLNVAGLSLARATSREGELTVRSALGASRVRLVRQLLVEGSLLGAIGGAAGALFAVWGMRAARVGFRLESSGLSLDVDHRILAFTAAVAVLAGMLSALFPSFRTARRDLYVALRRHPGSGPPLRAGRPTHLLLAAQMAAGLVLVTGAGVLGSEFLKLRYLDLGFDPRGLHRVSLFGGEELRDAPEGWRPDVEAARTRVAAVPGVERVALLHENAMHPAIIRPDVAEDASASEGRTPRVLAVDAGYFETLGTPILRGRGFTAEDRRGERPVAVVNEAGAARFWPGQDALGRQVFAGDSAAAGEWLTVVGVAADVERGEMSRRHWPVVYRPLEQAPLYHTAAGLYVRLAAPSESVLSGLQTAVRETLGHPTGAFEPAGEDLDRRFRAQRFNALAMNLFAGFALLLAAMGIYGSVAYAVAGRTREIGVRVALGAAKGRVVRLVAGHTALVASVGLVLGLLGSLAVARLLESFVSATSVMDPWTFVGSASLVCLVVLLATYLPARRATAVDPVIALRSE